MVLILDGHNVVFRAFYVSQHINQPIETTIEIMIRGLRRDFAPSQILVAWDSKINPTNRNFRHELSGNLYKGNREASPALQYIDTAKALLESKFGARSVHPSNLEGDDVIRWLSLNFSPSVIVSTDQDLIQLVSEYTSIWSPIKKALITSSNVKEFTNGVDSIQDWLIYRSIVGDKSDNIEGVKGVGKVRAPQLIDRFKRGIAASQEAEIIRRNLQILDLAYATTVEPNEYAKYEAQVADLFEDKPF